MLHKSVSQAQSVVVIFDVLADMSMQPLPATPVWHDLVITDIPNTITHTHSKRHFNLYIYAIVVNKFLRIKRKNIGRSRVTD